MKDNERLIERAKAAEKSLRWLANIVYAPGSPDYNDSAGRLALCIHDYCGRGADSIRDLISALSDRQTCRILKKRRKK